MRIFALQTSIGELRRKFIVEGEEEILTTRRHALAFFGPMVGVTMLALVIGGLIAAALTFVSDPLLRAVLNAFLGIGAILTLYRFLCAVIDWRYDFLIVTTEKVIVIDHTFIIHQAVNPVHLENIASTRFESQYLGVFRCGKICISLKEREGGTTKEIFIPCVPQPDVITSAIENAIALEKQRSKHVESQQEQLPKVQEVQQKIVESAGTQPAASAEPPPPEDAAHPSVQP